MCRWIEDAGGSTGCVADAALANAFATVFCISTDATGIGIRPEPSEGKGRQPCRRGHFFVKVADRDYVLFEYVPRETSAAVREVFRGYSCEVRERRPLQQAVPAVRGSSSTTDSRKARRKRRAGHRRRWLLSPQRPLPLAAPERIIRPADGGAD
jgi:hypothetical protein